MNIEGFNWEEVSIEGAAAHYARGDFYIGLSNGKPERCYASVDTMTRAGIPAGSRLTLYSQGKAIYMLKADAIGKIRSSAHGNARVIIGGRGLARRLYALTDTTNFEVLDAEDGYIIIRPIK